MGKPTRCFWGQSYGPKKIVSKKPPKTPKNGQKSPLIAPNRSISLSINFFSQYYGSFHHSTSLVTPPDSLEYFWRVIEAQNMPPKKTKSTNNQLVKIGKLF